MLKTIIQKELLENFKSLKVVFFFLVCFTLIGISSFVMLQHYKTQLVDYESIKSSPKELVLREKPSPLSLYVTGTQDLMERTFIYQKSDYEAQDISLVFNLNIFQQLFPTLDFLFLTKMVLSFLGIVCGFNLVCEEKQSGCLLLILSNSVSKGSLILGKMIAHFLLLAISLIFSFFFFHFLLISQPEVSFSPGDYLRLALILFFSLLYVNFFFLIGVWVSTITDTVKSSIITSFLCWALLVIVLPTIVIFTVKNAIHIPNTMAVQNNKIYHQTDILQDPPPREIREQRTFAAFESITQDYRNLLYHYANTTMQWNQYLPTGAYTLLTTDLAGYGLKDEYLLKIKISELVRQYRYDDGQKPFVVNEPLVPKSHKLSDIAKENGINMLVLLCYNVIIFFGCMIFFQYYDVK